MKYLLWIFISATCWAQNSIDYSIPTTPFVNPEAVGQILQFRAFSFFYPAYRVQYTPDTGPWPPDFDNKSYNTDYTIATGIEFGLTKGLDLLVYGDYLNSYFFGTVGVRYQFIGQNATDHRPGLQVAVAALHEPVSRKSYDSRSGCIIFCTSWDSRRWDINRSSEHYILSLGYRWMENWRTLLQFGYQRYRMYGSFDKYDSIGPRTAYYDLSNSGESKTVHLTAVYDFKLGPKWRASGYLGATGANFSNDKIESRGFLAVHGGFTFHFGRGMPTSH